MDKKLQNTDGNYLFNVDILINARTNPLAMQYLLELLNNNDDKVTDFKINSGLELGRTIDTLLRSAKQALNQEITPPIQEKLSAKNVAKPTTTRTDLLNQLSKLKTAQTSNGHTDPFAQIHQYIKSNQLVRIRTNRQGKQLSMPCRILNFDESARTISVYHVDEKQVYTFKLNEIDEFQ